MEKCYCELNSNFFKIDTYFFTKKVTKSEKNKEGFLFLKLSKFINK